MAWSGQIPATNPVAQYLLHHLVSKQIGLGFKPLAQRNGATKIPRVFLMLRDPQASVTQARAKDRQKKRSRIPSGPGEARNQSASRDQSQFPEDNLCFPLPKRGREHDPCALAPRKPNAPFSKDRRPPPSPGSRPQNAKIHNLHFPFFRASPAVSAQGSGCVLGKIRIRSNEGRNSLDRQPKQIMGNQNLPIAVRSASNANKGRSNLIGQLGSHFALDHLGNDGKTPRLFQADCICVKAFRFIPVRAELPVTADSLDGLRKKTDMPQNRNTRRDKFLDVVRQISPPT